MALKYQIKYNDLEGVTHKADIYEENYNSQIIEINGTITLDYGTNERVLEPIRGNGLRIDLEAGIDRTFEDLYLAPERTHLVEYSRDNIILFKGWINPEGYFEDYVADKWYVSLDCVDGLSFLESLSYVDANGVPFIGKQKQLDLIVNCLRRTGITANINTDIDIFYTGLADTVNILENVYVNTERFKKKDKEQTLMSCEEVLKDTLTPYSACITMHNGEWFIYKPNQLYKNTIANFFRYDSEGTFINIDAIDFRAVLGSQINGFYPHHCSGNQSKTIDRAIGAYRVNYKYGIIKSALSNETLINIGGVIDEWTILQPTRVDLPPSGGSGLTMFRTEVTPIPVLRSIETTVSANLATEVTFQFNFSKRPGFTQYAGYSFKVILKETATPTNLYYYGRDGVWYLNSDQNILSTESGYGSSQVVKWTLEINQTPVQGEIYLEILEPSSNYSDAFLSYVRFSARELEGSQNAEGEFHTHERILNPSTKIEDNTEVYTGDEATDLFLGTLYKADQTTPTSTWFRKGFTEEKELLRIMGGETMRMRQSNSIVFSGDIYGYLPYLSITTIDGLDGLFMILEYSYDTKNNITTIKFKQVYGNEIQSNDLSYLLTLDYGNVVTPTING